MTVEIRPAEPGDLPAVRAVARRAWYAVHEPIVGAENVEQFLEEYYSHDALVERFNADGPFLLADEEAVVGFAVAGSAEEPSVFVLDRIYVHPDRWGEGIGGRLLRGVECRAEDTGGERIRLDVMAENDRAVGFYKAAGYKRIGEHDDNRVGTTVYEYERVL
jgi:ribosomal protein S18 acetylase RimI-like enzyme